MLLLLVFLAPEELLSLILDWFLKRELHLLVSPGGLVDRALASPSALIKSGTLLVGVLARR